MQDIKRRKYSSTNLMYPGTPIRKYYPDRSSMRPKLAPSQLAQVKRVINRNKETKLSYGNVAADLPDYNGILRLANHPAQGSNGIQRIGDEIQNVRLEFRCNVQYVDDHVTRIIAFQWKSANDTAPTPSDVLQSVFFGSFNAVNSPYNEDSQKKVKILFDKVFTVNSGSRVQAFKANVKCLPIEFKQGSQTLGTNMIYVLQVQDGILTLNETYYVTTIHFNDA